MASFFDKLKEK